MRPTVGLGELGNDDLRLISTAVEGLPDSRELRRERASEGGTEGGVCDRDDSNPLDEPDARVDWSDLPDGILHRVFQLLFQEKDGHQIVGTCGQVCRGWHDDAWDVLMQDTAATRRPVPGVAPEDNDEADGGEGMMNGDAKKEDSTVRARRETSDASSMDEDIVSKRRKLPDESEAVSAPSGAGGPLRPGGRLGLGRSLRQRRHPSQRHGRTPPAHP